MEIKTPYVFIILINYNNEKLTKECLNSLKEITYQRYEIIVVDNSSNEHSINYLAEAAPDAIILESKINLGFTGGNNLGIKAAYDRGADYVVLLNNDTTVEPDFLEPLLKSFDDEKVGISTGLIMYEDDKTKVWYGGGKINLMRGSGIMYGRGKEISSVDLTGRSIKFASGCLLCISRVIIDEVGMLNEDFFAYQEDTDYCLRVVQSGYKIIFEPNSKIYHTVNATVKNINFPDLYYQFRNRLYLIKLHAPVLIKQIGYSYIMATMILKIIYWTATGKPHFIRMALQAVRDFLQQKMGRIEAL